MLDGQTYEEPTVGEIIDGGLFIRVNCACGHEREMSPKLICIGRNVTLNKLASMITCSRCRQKGLDARVSAKSAE